MLMRYFKRMTTINFKLCLFIRNKYNNRTPSNLPVSIRVSIKVSIRYVKVRNIMDI